MASSINRSSESRRPEAGIVFNAVQFYDGIDRLRTFAFKA